MGVCVGGGEGVCVGVVCVWGGGERWGGCAWLSRWAVVHNATAARAWGGKGRLLLCERERVRVLLLPQPQLRFERLLLLCVLCVLRVLGGQRVCST